PQLCEAETEFFSRLLGTHVQRLATIAHGDGVCTTFIPHSAPHAEPPPTTFRPTGLACTERAR
ncbi:transcriptional regulator, partial [Streptomyces sp. NPDC058877]